MTVTKRHLAEFSRPVIRYKSAALLISFTLTLVACANDGAQKSSEQASQQVAEMDAVVGHGAEDVLADGLYDSGYRADSVNTVSPDPVSEDLSGTESTSGGGVVENFEFSTVEDANTLMPASDFNRGPYCLGIDREPVAETLITPSQACKRISDRLASVSYRDCIAAKLEASQCYSVSGFPILVREFPPLSTRQPLGRILIIGGTHGDELTSVSVVFRWIAKLNKYHSGLFHWHIAPMMNPDGVLKRAATRTNQNGVDLNRNLPSADWETNALRYWQEKRAKNPRRYPGEKAASEPETQWLIDEINAFKPNAIISVHAPYGVVDFDSLLLNTAPKNLGKLHLNLLGTYPGSLGNYAGINRNIPVITLELPNAWVMPTEAETTKIWEDIVSWMRKNLNQDMVNNKN